MTTTYKKLASYFLQRDLTTTATGDSSYYYGGTTDSVVPDDFTSDFSSFRVTTARSFEPGSPSSNLIELGKDTLLKFSRRDHVSDSPDRILSVIDKNTGKITYQTNSISGVTAASQNEGIIQAINVGENTFMVQGYFGSVSILRRVIFTGSEFVFDESFSYSFENSSVRELYASPSGDIYVTHSGINYFRKLSYYGEVVFETETDSFIQSLTFLSDGRIFISGNIGQWRGTTCRDNIIVNKDLTLDQSFYIDIDSDLPVRLIYEGEDFFYVASEFGGFAVNGVDLIAHIVKISHSGSILDYKSLIGYSAVSSAYVDVGNFVDFGAGKLLGRVSTEPGGFELIVLNSDLTIDRNFSFAFLKTNYPNIFGGYIYNLNFLYSGGKIFVSSSNSADFTSGYHDFSIIEEIINIAPHKLLYTVQPGTECIIKNIFATNHNDFPVFYDILIVPSSDLQTGISEKHYYVWDNLIDDNSYDLVSGGITLSAGDEIYVYSSSDENISFNIFGVEIAV